MESARRNWRCIFSTLRLAPSRRPETCLTTSDGWRSLSESACWRRERPGRRVLKHALAQGHFITVVARHPERLSSADRLSFIRGDVLSPGGLTGALEGVEAVVSCIGPEKYFSPGTLMSDGVAGVLNRT